VALPRGGFADLSVINCGAGLALIGGDADPNLVFPGRARFVFVHDLDSARANGTSHA